MFRGRIKSGISDELLDEFVSINCAESFKAADQMSGTRTVTLLAFHYGAITHCFALCGSCNDLHSFCLSTCPRSCTPDAASWLLKTVWSVVLNTWPALLGIIFYMAENAHMQSLGLKHSLCPVVLDQVHFLHGSSGRHSLLEMILTLFQHDSSCADLPLSAFCGGRSYPPEELSLPGESARVVRVQMWRDVMTHAVPPLGLGRKCWPWASILHAVHFQQWNNQLNSVWFSVAWCAVEVAWMGRHQVLHPEESIITWRAVIF